MDADVEYTPVETPIVKKSCMNCAWREWNDAHENHVCANVKSLVFIVGDTVGFKRSYNFYCNYWEKRDEN